MESRNCDQCGKVYQAKRPSSRYCSDLCRKRAQRSPQILMPLTAVPLVPLFVPTLSGGTVEATRRELERAEMVESSLGQVVLILAGRLDAVTNDTGSSMAALAREHRAALAAALESGKVAESPLDELARRRRERRERAHG